MLDLKDISKDQIEAHLCYEKNIKIIMSHILGVHSNDIEVIGRGGVADVTLFYEIPSVGSLKNLLPSDYDSDTLNIGLYGKIKDNTIDFQGKLLIEEQLDKEVDHLRFKYFLSNKI